MLPEYVCQVANKEKKSPHHVAPYTIDSRIKLWWTMSQREMEKLTANLISVSIHCLGTYIYARKKKNEPVDNRTTNGTCNKQYRSITIKLINTRLTIFPVVSRMSFGDVVALSHPPRTEPSSYRQNIIHVSWLHDAPAIAHQNNNSQRQTPNHHYYSLWLYCYYTIFIIRKIKVSNNLQLYYIM